MIQKTLDDFANGVLSRLENAYNDEILDTFNDMPKSIVKFNNTEALKKAQMYVRHTNRIFNRYFSRLIINLFAANGDKVSIAKDTKGECILNKSRNSRIHFLSLEQVAGFPNVPWFKKSTINISRNSNTTTDIYVIMVKMDPKGRKLMNLIEYHTFNSPYQYIAFEDFIKKELGEKIQQSLIQTFKIIEHKSANFQWYELARTCNETNIEDFKQKIMKMLPSMNYLALLKEAKAQIDTHSLQIIHCSYITEKRYNLLLNNQDYSTSFLTSEWLYKLNNRDNLLDKTYIVTGYIKSIEQLLAHIVKSQSGELKISILNHRNYETVPANSSKSLSATLGNMIHFMKSFNNRSIYFDKVSPEAIRVIADIIQDWVNNERNGYFHKENIKSLDKVQKTRNRTLLIYYLLLGSIKSIGEKT